MNELTPEWDLIQAFLDVSEHGSFSKAAQAVGLSQPTLSRKIAELEKSLATTLFERSVRGLRLTQSGMRMLEPARRMRTASRQVIFAVEQSRTGLVGTVRISASEMTSAHVLPPLLGEVRRHYPQIQLELVASDDSDNLLEREADIAIRHFTPSEDWLIARQLGALQVAAWAHSDYLHSVDPERRADPLAYQWLGMDRSDFLLRQFHRAGMAVGREFFPLRCDSQAVLWQMALAGLGVGYAPTMIAQRHPEMRRVLPEFTQRDMPVWLVSHRELRNSACLRAVFDLLAQQWSALLTHDAEAAQSNDG